MRTWIFLSGLIIASAINPTQQVSHSVVSLVVVLFFLGLFADLVEIIKKF